MSRQLDAAIAEALGKTIYKLKYGVAYEKLPPLQYSTDGNAMLELDREMRVRGFWLIGSTYFKLENGVGWWRATYSEQGKDEMYSSSSLCEAYSRALAAYKALTGKEWQD